MAVDQKLIDGLNKHASTVTSFLIAGTTMATKDVLAVLQARIDASKATLTSRAAWQADRQAELTEHAKTQGVVSGLKQALLVAFAGQVDALSDFGLSPRKAAVRTPAQKQAAAAKAKATRAARHTMGPKQKAAIKGTAAAPIAPVPAPVGNPVANPVANPGGPSPAPSAPTAPVASPPAAPPVVAPKS